MKVAFIYGKQPGSTLTKLFTGSTCYHVGFTDGIKFWDMSLIRRRRNWLESYGGKKFMLAECPVPITANYLDHQLDTDENRYGWVDYFMFAIRPIYHLFGKSTRNASGVICSEMVYNDMLEFGWSARFNEIPSPADLEMKLFGRKNAIRKA